MTVPSEGPSPAHSERQRFKRTPRWLSWVVVSAGVVLSVLAFALLQGVEERNVSLQAADAVSTRTASLNEAIHDRLALVASARLIFDVSDEVTRSSFGELNRALASDVVGLKALFFLRRIEATERSSFEEWREHDLQGFKIRDVAPGGGQAPAADRAVYFPIDFVEPSNALAGLDPGGDPRCRKALDAATDFNQIAGTVGPGLLGDPNVSLFVAAPVYRSPNVPQEVAGRRRALRGFVGILTDVGPLVDSSLPAGASEDAVDTFVFDEHDTLVYSRHESTMPLPSPITPDTVGHGALERPFDVAGMKWRLIFRPHLAESPSRRMARFLVLLLGLLLTTFIVLYTRRLQTSEERLEALVEARTRDLSATLEQLQQAQKMEAVGRLTGGIAHDFNNLLTVVLGNVSLARESVEDEHVRTALLDPAIRAVERGADLTQRLLAFSRRQALRPTAVDLPALVANVTRLLERSLGGGVVIVVKSTEGLWPVLVDAAQVETALVNLALNARDAMPDGGTIAIAMENTMLSADPSRTVQGIVPGAFVLVSVSDTGVGMTEAVREQAFEPFFTTKPVGKGSGLGLSMVYGFVMQSNGHITLTSAPGRGTTVRMYFPRAADRT
jgi:signal transduction histidine kinase